MEIERNITLQQKRKVLLSRALRFGIIFIIALGLLIAFTNLKELQKHILSISLKLFLAGEACALGVYFFEGLFLLFSLKLFKEKISFFQALKSAFIINALGYLVSFGGLTPFATHLPPRYIFLKIMLYHPRKLPFPEHSM